MPTDQEILAQPVRAAADLRAQARAARSPVSRAMRAAVLSATQAGASQTEIVDATVAAKAGVSRQTIHATIGRAQPQDAHAAWEDAGSPDKAQALAAVKAAAPAYEETTGQVRRATANLVDVMDEARDRGLSPSAIVAASGFAKQTGYDYLAAVSLLRKVERAVAIPGLNPRDSWDKALMVWREGTRVVAMVGLSPDDVKYEEIPRWESDVRDRTDEALASIGCWIKDEDDIAAGYAVIHQAQPPAPQRDEALQQTQG